nr:hypothetical protein [Tanacetum cinerariifolium]
MASFQKMQILQSLNHRKAKKTAHENWAEAADSEQPRVLVGYSGEWLWEEWGVCKWREMLWKRGRRTLGGRGCESFWEGGDDFEVDVLCFHTCLTDVLGFLEKLEWWFEQDINDEGEENEEGDGGSEGNGSLRM